jgi:hypothetical protein
VVELAAAVGVPDIKPVDVEKVNPESTKDGEIEYELTTPAELVML